MLHSKVRIDFSSTSNECCVHYLYFIIRFTVFSNSYQERLGAFAGLAENAGTTSEPDENSLDNLPSNAQPSLPNDNAALLQNSIDKNIIAEAQEIISSLQVDGQNNNEFNDVIKTDPDSCISSTDDIDEFEDEMSSFASDGPMLPERDIVFNLQAPAYVPNYLNMHYVCETGSRILLLSICWFKKFHAFNLLRWVTLEKSNMEYFSHSLVKFQF